MNKGFINSQKNIYLLVIFLLIVISSPFWLWQLKNNTTLDVLIIDKTVPNKSYREHKGLVWILNHEKYVKKNGERYSLAADYVGFKPKDRGNYDISPIPANLNKFNVIYLADSYGVYEEEFHGSNTSGKRSNSINGGLGKEEIEKIEETLLHSKDKTFIAEFNTFASPTEKEVREKISNLLHLSWSGWVGRYFTDLNNEEVPVWVKDNYEGNGNEWDFEGAGLVFINQDDYVLVIGEKEMKTEGVSFQLTNKGKETFGNNLEENYQYWFDIVKAGDKDEILANFHIPLNKAGKNKLEENGIPINFPAVIHHNNLQYSSYYFAGDFADKIDVPNIYQTMGISNLKQYFGGEDPFYWKVYVPMMKNILKSGLHKEYDKNSIETVTTDLIKTNSNTSENYIQIRKNGKWKNILIKGVNLGIAKPGTFPGETAITKDEYFRWFKAIGDMNANTIRVYTLHPPAFYQALYEYNQIAKEPLYLFHGAWINEEKLVSSQDAYNRELKTEFQSELKNMVDIIHGNANLSKRLGHASGKYKYDISPYVLGYLIGIEWDPDVVQSTNQLNKKKDQFNGTYFKTNSASPFEIWLAENMEFVVKYETDTYQWQHNMSFTNWITTDLLSHPSEPSEKEDMESVNPNHIVKKDNFHSGLFASYHVYPYYPDFLNYEKKYQNFINKHAEKNRYEGYLHDLISVHQMPVVVAEFGVPSSRGLTHVSPDGMNQGFLSEVEQGEINKRMFNSIVDQGYAGGVVFSWQDEWFKRTWNTMDYDNPNRRPYWSNIQTNEQHFGLLQFAPGKPEGEIYIDGDVDEWNKLNIEPFYNSKENTEIEKVYITSDVQQIYIRLDYKEPIKNQKSNTFLAFDTISNQGQKTLTLDKEKIKSDIGFDFLLNMRELDKSRLLVDSYYDTFYYHYGYKLKMIQEKSYANKKNNGKFHPIRLALNKEMYIPSTKEKIAFHSYETGNLLLGNGNPNDKNYNSLTDISISTDRKKVEVRIPWALFNIKDPSLNEVQGDIWKKGLESSVKVDGIKVAVITTGKEQMTTFPKSENHNTLDSLALKVYRWDSWEEPIYHERLKKSYGILKEVFRSVTIGEES